MTNTIPDTQQPQTKGPAAGKGPVRRQRGGPLSQQELDDLTNAFTRTPGLGRIALSLIRNRSARVIVPETAFGGEMITIIGELDRLSARAERLLSRAMTLENLQEKTRIQEKILALITPLAELTAEIALKFDNPQNPIVRHSRTKSLLHAQQKPKPGATSAQVDEAHGEASPQ